MEVRPEDDPRHRHQSLGGRPRDLVLARHRASRSTHRHRDDQRVPGAARRQDRPAAAGAGGPRQYGHRRDGEVQSALLHQHATGALQEPRDHRGPHRGAGPLRHSWRSACVRPSDRQGGLAIPRRPAPRRRVLRHVGDQWLAGSARPRRVDSDDGRPGQRSGVHRARQRHRSELRQQPAGRESLRHQSAGPSGLDRHAQVAFPDDPSRHLRLGSGVAARADRGHERRLCASLPWRR